MLFYYVPGPGKSILFFLGNFAAIFHFQQRKINEISLKIFSKHFKNLSVFVFTFGPSPTISLASSVETNKKT